MLIPRFSLRWLLGVMTLCAALSLLVSLAIRGETWAIGLSVGVGSLGLLAVLHVLTFLGAWTIAQFEAAMANRRGKGVSPFAVSMTETSPFAGPVQSASEEPPPVTG